MAIEYDKHFETGTVICDIGLPECATDAVFDGTFQSVVEQAKAMGWKVKKTDGVWEHLCPTCREH